MIKNHMLQVPEGLDDETLLKLNMLLNTHLNGLPIEEINLGLIAALKQQAGIHSQIVGEVLDAVAEVIKEEEDLEIYTSGANNIFKYPELADHEKASELINPAHLHRLVAYAHQLKSVRHALGITFHLHLGIANDRCLARLSYEILRWLHLFAFTLLSISQRIYRSPYSSAGHGSQQDGRIFILFHKCSI